MRYCRIVFVLMSLMILAEAVLAREAEIPQKKQPYVISRATSPIKVDGVLSEAAWEHAWKMDLAYEIRPGENTAPPVRTEVLVTYDDRNAYFAFRAWDPEPGKIRAHLSDRDQIGNDDWVVVILDTFNDERRDFALMVNPMGVQADFIENENSSETEWDAIWESKATITEWGWVAEIRVPFSSLRFQHLSGPQVWGMDAVRNYPRAQTYRFGLFPRDRNRNCYLCQAVKIQGFEGVSPGRNLEITPTVTAIRSDARPGFPIGDFERQAQKADLGLTTRWGITPNLTVTGTVNPDFSQVEADALQVGINEPFALYFAEKRPFFMEGADYFNTPLSAVYTRTLRDPDWGIKLTGKEGSNTLGAYVVKDSLTNLLFPGCQGSDGASLAQESMAAVFRYKRDLGRNYTLGALVTDRQGDGYFNRVAGLDGNLRFSGRDSLQVQVLASRTRYPGSVAEDYGQPEGRFGGRAMDFTYVRSGRNVSIWAEYKDIGEGFRADLGFLPKVGYRGIGGGSGYTWQPKEKSWYSRMELDGEFVQHLDSHGDLLDRTATATFAYEGEPWQSHSMVQLSKGKERYAGKEFDNTSLYLHQCMNPGGNIHVWCDVRLGDRVDYLSARGGRRFRLYPGVTYNIGSHLRLEGSYTLERMKVPQGRLYTANLTQGAAAYQFSDRALLKATLQYTDYRYDLANYSGTTDPVFRHLYSQVLFSYKINPQTVFFLGYSDNAQAGRDFPLTRSDRTVFMKLGYAWTL